MFLVLQDHIETLKAEKERRKNVFTSKKAEIVCMYDELDLVPDSSFAQVSPVCLKVTKDACHKHFGCLLIFTALTPLK